MEAQGQLQAGLPDPCILLGGQPRSGTTLLSSILRSTPEHFQAFELHIRKPSFVVGLNGRYTRNIFKDLGLPPEDFDRIVKDVPQGGMNLGAWVGPKEEVSAEPLTGKETSNFAGELRERGRLTTELMRHTARLHGKRTWGFKILGDIIHADVYRAVWPNAVFILLIRDPRDQAMSVLKLNEQRAARKQQEFYSGFRDAAQGWRDTIEQARRVLAAHRIAHIETRYEDLVADTDREIERLSAALHMDLAQGLNFHEQDFIDTHTQRFKHHDNLRNQINASSLGKWRSALGEQEMEIFRDVAGDLMRELNYT